MAWTSNFPDRDRMVVLRLFLAIVLALLAVEIWTLTQSAYLKQEIDDLVLFLMLPFGVFLFLSSCFVVRRHRWWGLVGIFFSIVAVLLFSWWRFVPRGIID